MSTKLLLNRLLRLCAIIIGIIIIYLVFKYMFIFLYPFVIALMIALFLNPVILCIEQKLNFRRSFAILLTFFLLAIVIFGTSYLVVSELLQGLIFLADKTPIYFQSLINEIDLFIHSNLIPLYNYMTSFLKTLHPEQQRVVSEYIESGLSQIGTIGAFVLQNTFLKIRLLFSYIPQSIAVMIFIFIATFLITKDLPQIQNWLRKVFPVNIQGQTIHVIQRIKSLLLNYVKAQFIIMSITGIIIFIGLFMLNIQHALTIALVTAIIDLLPFIGTGIVFIPWIFYLFFSGDYHTTIQLATLYAILILVRQFIEPKILSDQLGVRPLVTLIVMFICFQIWGIGGIIVAPFLIILYHAFFQAGIIHQLIQFVMK